MSNYDIVINNDYITNCTYTKKGTMFPTFDVINKFCETSAIVDSIIPTTETSEIIDRLSDYFGYASINSFYKNIYSYRNVCLPLSKQYPTLQSIAFRLRSMWAVHDVVNKLKFFRLIDTVTTAANISPLYNRHKKWSSEDVATPNTVVSTTGTNTKDNDTTTTDTKNLSDTKTGTEQRQKSDTETHSGSDTTTTNTTSSSQSENVNGITAYDTTEFANNDNSTNTGTETENTTGGTTYGEQIANAGTDTTTYNTTHRNTGTDTTVIDGTQTETLNTRKATTGTETKNSDGDIYENDISLADAQKRENAMISILAMYFDSVMHDLSLYTLEEIW